MSRPSGKIRLRLLGLPNISSLADFSAQTHLSKGLIFRLCRFSDYYYKTFQIPKKNGKLRTIAQPSRGMKALQGWILRNILDQLQVSSAAKGFEKGMNIADNAIPHRGSNSVLSIDLEDFFPSVRVNQVWSVFHTIGYSSRISASLAAICCYKGRLPQGAPTSPKLANLVTLRFDQRILGFVGKRSVVYTRYADDLTFSAFSSAKLMACLPVIRRIITSEGFSINENKTRIAGPGRQHKITGLVVTDQSIGIGRKVLRKLRAEILSLCRYPAGKAPTNELERIKGWLAFVKGVDASRHSLLESYISRLAKKHNNTALSEL